MRGKEESICIYDIHHGQRTKEYVLESYQGSYQYVVY